MVTLFSMPKPFIGHIGTIQRNAIESWVRLGEGTEVILLGDDAGVAEAAKEFGAVHVPAVSKNQYGTPLVSATFAAAQAKAKHKMMCFINTDIILFDDFLRALGRVRRKQFLMLGQRCDLDVKEAIHFGDVNWRQALIEKANREGEMHGRSGVDYYAYTAGMWGDIPPFAVGRTRYDNWLIWKARSLGIPVVDATDAVFCIHQNHERTYSSLGKDVPNSGDDDLCRGIEAEENHRLAGGWERIFTLLDATWRLTESGPVPLVTAEHLSRRWEASKVLNPRFGNVARRVALAYGRVRSATSQLTRGARGPLAKWVQRGRNTNKP